MLKNAKTYNDEDSDVYRDANELEVRLKSTWQKIVAEKDEKVDPLFILFERVFDFEDETGRQLIVPFMKLPAKAEFPSYYEVIKRPVDVAKIRERLFSHSYALLDDMFSDFRLLFDNTMKFNEPDSQLYRDAQILLRVCQGKRNELLGIAPTPVTQPSQPIQLAISGPAEAPPDVIRALQDMMKTLLACLQQFKSSEQVPGLSEFYMQRLGDVAPTSQQSTTHQSLGELSPVAAFDRVKQNVELGRYRRLDRFQDDVFEILHNVRALVTPQSTSFQASIKLQEEFIRQRDVLTEHGRRLFTPARNYTHADLEADVERATGVGSTPLPGQEEEVEDGESVIQGAQSLNSVTVVDQNYAMDDYVYVKLSDGSHRVVLVKRLYEDEQSKQTMVSGEVFLRPEETCHLINRKFYKNELFRSDIIHHGPIADIVGRCLVLLPRTFARFQVEGLQEKDVFICDHRYSTRQRMMKKLNSWKGVYIPGETIPETDQSNGEKPSVYELPNSSVKLVRRATPIQLHRSVPSVFSVKQNEQAAATEAVSSANPSQPNAGILNKFRENVPIEVPGCPPGVKGFEQLVGPAPNKVALKLGDFAYISLNQGQIMVIRVERLYTQTTPEGDQAFVGGCRLFLPNELYPNADPNARELFLSVTQVNFPMSQVLGRCIVFASQQYCSMRCPEIMERDTFICDTEYLPPEGQGMPPRPRKITSVAVPNLKHHSARVLEDEVFFFVKPIQLKRSPIGHHVPLSSSSSCESTVRQRPEHADDSSLHGPDELARMAVGHDDIKYANSPSSSLTHSETKKPSTAKKGKVGRGNGTVSGWTVFSRYMHNDKKFAHLMAGKEFPERARIIAEEWRQLSQSERAKYVEEARIEEEKRRAKRAAQAATEAASVSSIDAAKSPAPVHSQGMHPHPMTPGQPMMPQHMPQQQMYQDPHQMQQHGMMPQYPQGGPQPGYMPRPFGQQMMPPQQAPPQFPQQPYMNGHHPPAIGPDQQGYYPQQPHYPPQHGYPPQQPPMSNQMMYQQQQHM